MRKLRLVVKTAAGALPMVVAAQVSPGCIDSHGDGSRPRSAGDQGGGSGAPENTAGSAQSPAGSAAASGGGGLGSGGANPAGAGGFSGAMAAGTGGMGDFEPMRPILTDPGDSCAFDVELPEPGTPAEPGQICAASMMPVDSNRAALVTLQRDYNDQSGRGASGTIAIDSALEPLLVGTPTVELIDITEPRLSGAAIGEIGPLEMGRAPFSVTFPESVLQFESDGMIRATFRVSLELACGGYTQIVHSATDVHLCSGFDDHQWVSTGNTCTVCRIIAEMAPSPIVPEPQPSSLPLARALRLRIVELARVSETVVLLAENDGGEGVRYQWHASSGQVQALAPDVVAWSLSGRGPAPFIQAAVIGEHGAAVRTFSFNAGVA